MGKFGETGGVVGKSGGLGHKSGNISETRKDRWKVTKEGLQCESKNTPWGFLTFFSQTVGNSLTIFTHLLHVPMYASLQIFIQLSLTVTKLCHIKCEHPANFYISLELKLLNLFIEQMTSLLTSCYIRHVWWHYKSVCSLLINFHE